jgi:uncharacterized protein with von Willebrand factor type A (vWA) domain
MSKTKDIIRRLFGKRRAEVKPLPRATVKHNSVDRYRFDSYAMDSPRFKRVAVEDAPQIAPDVADPDPIDFTTATAEEIKEWQEQARAAKAARETAPPYDAWSDLTRDIFYSYHHPAPPDIEDPGAVDPSVALHAKIMQQVVATDDHAKTRNVTREDGPTAAMATMAFVKRAKELLEHELVEHARQSENFEHQRDEAENAQSDLDSLRDEARELHGQGQPIPGDLVAAIKEAVQNRNAAQEAAAQTAQQTPLPLTKAAVDAIKAAVADAAEAAHNASGIPSFGQGFGPGEPRYESPEQALDIADKWANDPTLQAVAQLYGRMKGEMLELRAKRVVGGVDEIVDLKFGDDLRKLAPVELGYLADDDYEDDFYVRFLAKEVLIYDTVGEEDAAKGPMVVVGDESGSMSGSRNVLLKAVALCMLNICRREKRDFAYVGFSDAGGYGRSEPSVHAFLFKASEEMQAQDVIDMCSHFYGGGTTPIIGVARAASIMDNVREFKKADIVMVTDGEASFGSEDKILRDRMAGKGVRFHGIGIPHTYGYLKSLAGDLAVGISEFDLENPQEITAHLATHLT